jgi:RNA recognition motif-containing protein
MEKKLHVGNLSYNTTEEQLETTFAQVGAVASVTVIIDRETGRSKGFGFVEMADESSAAAAVAQLNGTQIGGRAITVAEARPRAPRENRSSSRW